MAIDWKKAWAIAKSNLVRMSRDKVGLMMTLLMPMIIIGILGAALSGMFKQSVPSSTKVYIINRDVAAKPSSPQLGALALFMPSYKFGDILAEDVFKNKQVKSIFDGTVTRDREAAINSVRDGRAVALIEIPKTFSKDVLSGKRSSISIVKDPGNPLMSNIVEEIVGGFTDQMTSGAVSGKLLGMVKAGTLSNDTSWMPEVVKKPSGTRDVTAMQYYAAAMAVMFIVMTGFIKGAGFLREREIGTLNRMLASPTNTATVLAGNIWGSLMIILTQFVLLLIGTSLLYQVYWGPILIVILLGIALSLAATGIGLALASLVNNASTAEGSIGLVGNVFAALSGSMMPIYNFPPTLKAIAHAVPNYWAITGFTDMMGGLDASKSILPIAILTCIGLVGGIVGTIRLGRQ